MNINFLQHCAESDGIRILGFKCGQWPLLQENDNMISEQIIFSDNHHYQSFLCKGESVNTSLLGLKYAWRHKTRNAHIPSTVTLAAHAHQG